MKRIIMAACIVSLAACGGDKDDVATEQQQEWESQKQSLVYSFPDNNQQQVPVPSPVVLRFSSPVMETSPAVVLREVGGPIISEFETEWVDGKRGLIITPDSKLKPMTDYMVQIPAIELEKGMAPAKNIRFSTRALFEGPKSLVASDTFEVTRMIPDGENYAVMDFSSFRVQFSQPLDQTTVKYGDSADATVQLMGPEGLVDAHLLVSGHYMTVDPKDDLTPGMEYSLNMTTGITSTYGETLPGGSFGNPGDTLAVSVKVSPQDTKAPGTGLRVSMVQDVADTGELSPLTGQPINLVPMASVLLGEDTATQASGTVAAELAFVPNFPEATPFRVKRGSLIEGASIEVLIGGEVPAGFESGKVRMDFLSDATGYLLPNPYSNSDDAPRQVRLFMDVAVSTETPSANGAITQNLLHIELVGTSIVENGQMVINAIGVVEPNVLGSERAIGVLSFYMKSFDDQDKPIVSEDITHLVIQSINVGEVTGPEVYQRGNPVIINFNMPVLSGSIYNDFALMKDETNVAYSSYTDGASLVILPKSDLEPSVAGLDSYYTIKIDKLVGINGSVIENEVIEFKIPEIVLKRKIPDLRSGVYSEVDVQKSSTVVLSVYPGFPCYIEPSSVDIPHGVAGRCSGGIPGYTNGMDIDQYPADDLIPIPELPANHPIIVNFSKSIDENTVNDETFSVYEIDDMGEQLEKISGTTQVVGAQILFRPNFPWEPGKYYYYELKSNAVTSESPSFPGYLGASEINCNGSQGICDMDGLPIFTQPLGQLERLPISPPAGPPGRQIAEYSLRTKAFLPNAGGAHLRILFKASNVVPSVLQTLVTSPDVDTNNNFIHEKDAVPGDLGILAAFDIPFFNSESLTTGKVNGEFRGALHDYEERSPTEIDQFADEMLDVNGMLPLPNSAKVLSRNKNGWEQPFAFEEVDETFKMFIGPFTIDGGNIGCGYSYNYDFESGAPIPPPVFGNTHVIGSEPANCPEKKFVYMKSAIIASVTNLYDSNLGQKVLIWPSNIFTTSIPLYARNPVLGGATLVSPTGMQVLRMRYAKDDNGNRNQPIEGWIREDSNGDPYFHADIELYLDVPYVDASINGLNLRHNLHSYPISFSLNGPIHFLEDGRMVVRQNNENEVNIDMRLYDRRGGYAMGHVPLVIPAGGILMQLVSSSIK